MDWSLPQKMALAAITDHLLVIAGQGGGKTGIMAGKEFYMAHRFPKIKGLIGANTYNQLSSSTLENIFRFFGKNKMQRGIDYEFDKQPPPSFKRIYTLKDYEGVISYRNGKISFTRSLEKYKAIEGMEVGYALIDEVEGAREAAITDVISGRIRQMGLYVSLSKKTCGQLFYSENDLTDAVSLGLCRPFTQLGLFTAPSNEMWLLDLFDLYKFENAMRERCYSKTDFFHFEDERKTIIAYSAYHNEKNLSANYIPGRIALLGGKQSLILQKIYGIAFGKTGGELIHAFDRQRHVVSQNQINSIKFEKNYLYLFFDANHLPYCTCLVVRAVVDEYFTKNTKNNKQYDPKRIRLYVIDEICDFNNIEDTCLEFKRRLNVHTELYCNNKDELKVYVGGDPTLGTTQAGMKIGENPYATVRQVLKQYTSHIDWNMTKGVDGKQIMPSHVGRANFMNLIFAETINDRLAMKDEQDGISIQLLINEKCLQLIRDFIVTKADKDGSPIIEKGTTEDNISYEKNGHALSAISFGLVQRFNREYKRINKIS